LARVFPDSKRLGSRMDQMVFQCKCQCSHKQAWASHRWGTESSNYPRNFHHLGTLPHNPWDLLVRSSRPSTFLSRSKLPRNHHRLFQRGRFSYIHWGSWFQQCISLCSRQAGVRRLVGKHRRMSLGPLVQCCHRDTSSQWDSAERGWGRRSLAWKDNRKSVAWEHRLCLFPSLFLFPVGSRQVHNTGEKMPGTIFNSRPSTRCH